MLKRLAAFAPFLALGPFTGPLLALAAHYARRRRWGMAIICAVGAAEVWFILPTVLGLELNFIGHHLGR